MPQQDKNDMPGPRTLAPPISFLAEAPAIDGLLNADKAKLPAREFSYVIKGDPGNPIVPVTCRLAYGAEFFYLLIQVKVESFVCRDRGYQHGDGILLMFATPQPGQAQSPENYILGFWPKNDPHEPTGTIVWAHDGDWPLERMAESVRFVVRAHDGYVYYELLLPWEEVYPYHPWLSESIGGELVFVQAVGDDQATWYCMALDDWAKVIPGVAPYIRLAFEAPALESSARTYLMLDRSGHQGKVLHARSATLASEPVTETLLLRILAGEGEPLAVQSLTHHCEPGLSIHNHEIATTDLIPGGYRVAWRSKVHPARGTIGVSILPPFDLEAERRRLDVLGRAISPGSLVTLQFHLQALSARLAQRKPHKTCARLRVEIEKYVSLVSKAEHGDDVLARRTGFFRRAFRSELDGTLQPYTVRIPENFDPDRSYPLVVFLHGSDRDDTSLSSHSSHAGPADWIVVAPLGRGMTNAFTRDHAQSDIHEAIQDVCRYYPIDTNRIVLAGFSMGGYGVYRTHYETPGKFRALAVFSGIPDEASQAFPAEEHPNFLQDAYLAPFSDVPIFIFHGSADRNAPFEKTQQVVQKLRALGAPVEFYVQEGAGHVVPDEAATDAYYAWLDTITSG